MHQIYWQILRYSGQMYWVVMVFSRIHSFPRKPEIAHWVSLRCMVSMYAYVWWWPIQTLVNMYLTSTLSFCLRYYAHQLVCYVQVTVWKHGLSLKQHKAGVLLGVLHRVISSLYVTLQHFDVCLKCLSALRVIVVHSGSVVFCLPQHFELQ